MGEGWLAKGWLAKVWLATPLTIKRLLLLTRSKVSSFSEATHVYYWSLARSLKSNAFDLEPFEENL